MLSLPRLILLGRRRRPVIVAMVDCNPRASPRFYQCYDN